MRFLFALVLGVSSLCAAPVALPLPGQSSAFPGNVRGYWFQAPVAFDIVGLYIPTDASSDPMNIEVLRFDAPPPEYSTTTNDFTSLFRTVNDVSAGIVPVSIQVHAGDYIGILGQRGNVNSYASGDYVTDIFGQSVTLQRLGMQYVLASTPAQNVWAEASGSISRVEMLYDVSTAGEVPEPSTLLLSGSALLGLWARRRLAR
ncbi:PEP-CTERM sorting domain-containing protein [uncultured Paludibaculum sp.]|uniref:PEP-CTERM sorting domain-containing protein n=1 Tax=uncultured Paludibaculum sp. TaxID=1765020 RepID=UPI002AAB88AB|nr:PEP-CTERM sorting domain-containing protein [uncultured Paludibaculum sp.]